MAISSITDFTASVLARASATRTATPTPTQQTSSASAPVGASSLSNVSSLLQQTASLQTASAGFAQLGSLLQVAQAGTGQISSLLGQLGTIAAQATPPDLSNETLASLDSAFQDLISQIGDVAGNTQFGGTRLLNGSQSETNALPTVATPGAPESETPPLPSLPALTPQALFGDTTPNLLTPQGAQSALNAVTKATTFAQNASGSIATAQAQVSVASATVDTVLANQVASKSVLGENEVPSNELSDIPSELFSDASLAASVQTGNIPANILGLIND